MRVFFTFRATNTYLDMDYVTVLPVKTLELNVRIDHHGFRNLYMTKLFKRDEEDDLRYKEGFTNSRFSTFFKIRMQLLNLYRKLQKQFT